MPCEHAGQRRQALFLALLLSVGTMIAAAGSATLPVDAHEAFVVQSTQEMSARGDWIVPWFNGEPRLNKPPLNYWLTGIVAWLDGTPAQIKPWHARAVSACAALVMTVLTFCAARLLYRRPVAMLATAFLITSLGFFNYSHDARPDMLYAALCAAGYVAFMGAWKASRPGVRNWSPYLMWGAYALATLSKGPQLPAMYLLASLLFCRLAGMTWGETGRRLRPVTGLLLYALVTLPWWYLIQQELGGERLHNTQLSGSLLTAVRFDQFYQFYYFYRPLLLVLPWIVFLPHAVLRLLPNRERIASDNLLLLYLLVPALLLSFGSQERWFYMLPSLPVMILLLAAGAESWVNRRQEPPRARQRLLFLCLAVAVMFVVAGYRHTGWNEERFEFQELARHAQALVRLGVPVFTVNVSPDVYVYHLQTRIHQAQTLEEVSTERELSGPGGALLILRTQELAKIPDGLSHQILYTTRDKDNKTLSLVRLPAPP